MKNKKLILLIVLLTITLILGVVAVITSLKLRQKATVPPEQTPIETVNPTEIPQPKTSPVPVDLGINELTGANYVCQAQFTVSENLKCYVGACTTDAECPTGLTCEATDSAKPNNKLCVNHSCPTNKTCTCIAGMNCTNKKVYQNEATNTVSNNIGTYHLDHEITNGSDVSKGQQLVFAISYSNTGDTSITSTTITDQLSTKLTYKDGESGCTYTNSNRTVTCTVASVAAGAAGTKAFRVEVVDADTSIGDITNTATVTPAAGSATTCSVAVKVPTPATPQCNDTCSSASDCPSSLTCNNGHCRNPQCVTESSCSCPAAAKVCNDYCSDSSECPSGLTCFNNKCRNPQCTGETSCSCPSAGPQCNSSCTDASGCPSGMTCSNNKCRNPQCTDRTNCTCPAAGTPTPTPAEQLPKAGVSTPTFIFIGAGGVLTIIGIILAAL